MNGRLGRLATPFPDEDGRQSYKGLTTGNSRGGHTGAPGRHRVSAIMS